MFALGTFADGDRAFPGLVVGETHVVDLSQSFESVREILERWDESLSRFEALAEGAAVALGSLRVLAPFEPGQILQSGANYKKHVIELAVDQRIAPEPGMTVEEIREHAVRMMDERVNGDPYLFLGAHSAICGPYDDVVLPARGEQHDWELELAAVIGRPGKDVPVADALDHVAGYTICNDLTTRDLVFRPDLKALGTDWVRSKNAPSFLPLGPWIVPAAFVPDPMDLRIRLTLNGEVMQDESTADMIFDVARLVSYASSTVGLRAGDLLLTGSPAGNGTHHGRFLADGDVIESEITGLGQQRNVCRSTT